MESPVRVRVCGCVCVADYHIRSYQQSNLAVRVVKSQSRHVCVVLHDSHISSYLVQVVKKITSLDETVVSNADAACFRCHTDTLVLPALGKIELFRKIDRRRESRGMVSYANFFGTIDTITSTLGVIKLFEDINPSRGSGDMVHYATYDSTCCLSWTGNIRVLAYTSY